MSHASPQRGVLPPQESGRSLETRCANDPLSTAAQTVEPHYVAVKDTLLAV